MIKEELKTVILEALNLEDWDMEDSTKASDVPGWDSLNHINVVLAIERHYGIRFRTKDLFKLKNIGELQELLEKTKGKSDK
jgi:acyl carrier protein